MQDLHSVRDDCVWNADQTAVRMVPTSEYGWGGRGRHMGACIGDTRRQVTITLCDCMVQRALLCQIIYTGTTKASLPPGPLSTTTATPVRQYPDGLTATCTHNHWATTPSIMSLLQQMTPTSTRTRRSRCGSSSSMWRLVTYLRRLAQCGGTHFRGSTRFSLPPTAQGTISL